MIRGNRHRIRFARIEHIRQKLLKRALRKVNYRFDRDNPVIAVIGDHISDQIRSSGLYERHLLETLRHLVFHDEQVCKQQIALDVGANIGNHSMFLAGIFSRIIAFEPNPLISSILSLNLQLNKISNVEVKTIALSDRTTKQPLRFSARNLGAASLERMSAVSERAQYEVEVQLCEGDSILEADQPIGFIKIDVEGHEEAVLHGLKDTILRHQPILMVEQLRSAIGPQDGRSPAFRFLNGMGYTAYEFRRVDWIGRKIQNIVSVATGYSTYAFEPRDRLEQRDYPALLFVPVNKRLTGGNS